MYYSIVLDGKVVEGRGENTGALEFIQGAGEILPGLDARLLGLTAGSEHTVELPAESAYGLRDPAKVRRLPPASFGGMELAPGMKIEGIQDGLTRTATVVSVDSAAVTLDFNHPRAGKDIRVRLKILEVR